MTRILITEPWMPRVETVMRERYELVTLPPGDAPFGDRLAAAWSGIDILCPTPSDPLPASLMAQLPDSVRLIAVHGGGTNAIDIAGAARRDIRISNTPDVVSEDTADLAFGLILAACRGFSGSERLVRTGQWGGITITGLLGSRVNGKTIGIIGMGRIGKAVARRAAGFGMRILYTGPSAKPDIEAVTGAVYRPVLADLLGQADIVSLHCPLSPATRHLIDRDRLALMKRGAFLINAARGPLVDEAALVDALKSGALGGAGLDVYEQEPRLAEGLADLTNIVLLPHLGTGTVEAREAMGFRVVDNIDHFLATGRPLDAVEA